MISRVTFLFWLAVTVASSAAFGYAVHAQAVPDATEAIAKQIGWLVIQNANLQAQIDDLKKQAADCKPPADMPPRKLPRNSPPQ
jgi:hypothetical protein